MCYYINRITTLGGAFMGDAFKKGSTRIIKESEILSPDQAIFCFSHFFHDAKEGENKTVIHGKCKKCGAPNIKIVGISEKGRKQEEVEEIICMYIYCGMIILSSRNHTKTIEKETHEDPPPIYRREFSYIKFR